LPPKQDKKADAEIERIAAELAKAKSIEDVDDKLAETLFGDEINFIAAQVLANPPSGEPANDPHEVVVATGQPVARGSAAADLEVTLEDPKKLDDGGTDLSASQRFKTVRALNSDLHPSIQEPKVVTNNQAVQTPVATPESIEDQINTSMTQTLKALNVVPGLDAWRYVTNSESGRKTVESYLPLILSAFGAAGVLPFIVLRLMQGEWLAAIVDAVIVVGFVGLGIFVYRTRRVRIAGIGISIICIAGVISTVYIQSLH